MIISLDQAVTNLNAEQIVAIPTETVYGLAGNATSIAAVDKIYKAKNRPADNPLICHFYSLEQIQKYTLKLPEYLEILVESFCPGPITFLLAIDYNSPLLPSTRGLLSAACRIPSHETTLELLRMLDFPLAAPSANTSGRPSPTNAQMVEDDLGRIISGTLDGGQCQIGLESTIIDCHQSDSITILRPGIVGIEELNQALSKANFAHISVLNKTKNQQLEVTPGAKYRHYSPLTPIKLIDTIEDLTLFQKNYLVLSCSEKIQREIQNITWVDMGSQYDLEQIAYNLYSQLKSIDGLNFESAFWLDFEFDHSTSLGEAIHNRLGKILKDN